MKSYGYFKKLSMEFIPLTTNLKGEIVVEHLYPDNTGLTYYKLADTNLEQKILHFFEQKGLPDSLITYAEINTTIWLHRDINGTAVINHYISSPPASTIFYETTSEPDEHKTYDASKCTIVDSFVAKSGSTWVLDVSKVHSVKMLVPGLRQLISIGFPKLSYNDVCDILGGNEWI